MAIMVDDEAIDKVQSQFPPDEVCNSQYIQLTIACLLLTVNEGPDYLLYLLNT
jgi:hypothetical protein